MTTARMTLALTLAATTAGGCQTNPCTYAGELCVNGHALQCEENDWNELILESDTNCAAQGQICVGSGLAAACVDDVPCAASMCDGSQLVTCVSGHLFSRRDCAASASAPSTCAVAGGNVACVYTEAPCPASGADAFCSADGLTRWTGCSAGYGYPPTSDSGCYGGGPFVCAEGNGKTECVLSDRVPCDPNGLAFCSADGTRTYVCGGTGFAARVDQYCTGGQVCRLVLITSGVYAGQYNAVCR